MPPWFERTFTFTVDVDMHLYVRIRLRGAPARLAALTQGLNADVLTKQANGSWSIQENAGHLLDWSRFGRDVWTTSSAESQGRIDCNGRGLKALIESRVVQSGFGVYAGTAELKDGPLRVLPLRTFLKQLSRGHILH